MTSNLDTALVRRSVIVAVPQPRAFEVFTERFGTWWPKEYSIGESDLADFVVEPKAGGRWYEVGADGAECDAGRVIAYEPPDRIVVAWHLDGNFQFDPDPTHASEFEVRFIPEGDSTRVELEHRGFERHGTTAEAVFGIVESPSGWDFCLDRFAEAAVA
jgi:uncharacterized protein YndB with AHSA1/START domain